MLPLDNVVIIDLLGHRLRKKISGGGELVAWNEFNINADAKILPKEVFKKKNDLPAEYQCGRESLLQGTFFSREKEKKMSCLLNINVDAKVLAQRVPFHRKAQPVFAYVCTRVCVCVCVCVYVCV
jgi:hypothetical protein